MERGDQTRQEKGEATEGKKSKRLKEEIVYKNDGKKATERVKSKGSRAGGNEARVRPV